MTRTAGKGDVYVHQAERDQGGSVKNWNVIGLTDLGTSLVERYVYTPYGELTAHAETGYGDRDGDGDVDAADKGTPGTDCTGTVTGACRILDLDFDGDYDSTDAGLFDSLPQGVARHPGRFFTAVDQRFGHQGLLFEPEIGSYQNRARQYDPGKRRFVQRDPLAEGPGPDSFPDRLNVYRYVRNSPVMRTDASGSGDCACQYGKDHGPCQGHKSRAACENSEEKCCYKGRQVKCVWRGSG